MNPAILEKYVRVSTGRRVDGGKILFMAHDEGSRKLMLHINDVTNIHAVSDSFLREHPVIGGYYFRFEDGTESFCPAHSFHGNVITMAEYEAGLEKIEAEQAKENALDSIILPKGTKVGQISDGYHTFDELYDHRVRLFSSLMRAYPHLSWWSEKHHDGTAWDGWIIAGIDTPAGTVSYHLPVSEIKHLPIIAALPVGKEWDGHTPNDVLERLKSLWGEGAQHSASNLPAHQQRVIEERAELEDRHGKLSIFLDTPLFQTLPEEDRALLSEQYIHMTDLLNVLTRRIDRF